jgi:asparagine synthase (glutamine-hydrolysing)
MCGITGFVDFNSKSSKETIELMSGSLSHRGPDGQGTSIHQLDTCQVGLGHRRLSIIDLSSHAGQPMEFDGLHIVFNGEIYNYQDIKDELIRLGHRFITKSDTEVILHAWRQWGEGCIDQWRGMYAITLFDEQSKELICIRDRPGSKPFYYYQKDNLFLIGSELKSLLQHSGFVKEINPESAASFLQYGYVPNPHCIYKNASKIPPGHILKLDLITQNITISEYWNVYDHYNKPKLSISLDEAIKETEPILQKSFNYRMVSDVPVGVFLSGGYDSTCVAALLQKDRTDKIKTFTIGSVDNKLDEAPFAAQIAAHLGTDHTEYYCTSQEALNIIPELPHYFDEPFADSSAIPTILVSRLARKEVTVALSADGGDEVFAGYKGYDYISRYGKKLRSIPHAIRNLLVYGMDNISSESIPYFRNKYNFHGRYSKVRNILKNPSAEEFQKNISQAFSTAEVQRIFISPITTLKTAHTAGQLTVKDDDLSFIMAVDYQTYLVDDILQKVDRATMSASLEGREPFLDQNIIEWAAQLPSNYKYHDGNKKYILKQIVHQYVPQKMMDRPKMGFGIPMEKWLQNELKDLIKEYLNESSVNAHGLFNWIEIKNIVTQFEAGRTERHLQIWYLLMFQMWYKTWF